MSCFRVIPLLLVAANAVAAGDGAMVGGGVESDSENGLNLALIGGYGFTEKTWLTGGVARSSAELGTGRDLDNLYADVELDHWFEPIGVRGSPVDCDRQACFTRMTNRDSQTSNQQVAFSRNGWS